MAGCPKCACELPRANPGRPTVTRPNGFVTFAELRVGETINLPDEWFHPARERLPSTYYRILPHHDGVTPGSLGDAPGTFPDLDAAVTAVATLAALGDAAFTAAVGDAVANLEAAVKEAYASTTSADATTKSRLVKDATHWAWQRNNELAAAIAANDRAAITRARLDIQNSLSTALGNARLAILAHDPPASTPSSSYAPELRAAAKVAAVTIAADPNYCTSVTHPGMPVNAAVHRFKLAWNASQSPKVPIGTSNYEVATTVALAQVNGSAPSACGAGQRPVPAPRPPPPLTTKQKQKREEAISVPSESGWSLGTVVLGVAVAGAVAGGIAYLVAKPSKPARRTSAGYT
jgi:hypothetical protein